MGSLLGKIYSALLHEVRLWVTIAKIIMDAIMSIAYKHINHGLQSTSVVYNCSQSNSSGWVRVLILQEINILRDKRCGHTGLFSMCTATANRLWMLCQFTNKHLIYYQCPDSHVDMYTHKLCVKSHLREFFNCLHCEFLNREKFC